MRFQVRASLLSAVPAFVCEITTNFSTPPAPAAASLRAALSTTAGSASQAPAAAPITTTTTASSCTPQTARGRHVFKVAGYSLLKGLSAGKFVRSAIFAVGGYNWCVRYFPDEDRRDNCVLQI
ncbi:unnamed protein product [Urochloa humidicola]